MTRALDRSPGGESFRRIADALTLLSGPGRKSGKWVKFRCPTHDDKNPSLGVTYDAAKGRTQLRCFGSCDDTTILAALNLSVRDLFDDPGGGGSKRSRGASSNGLVDLAERRAAPASPSPPDGKPSSSKSKAQLGPVVATYTYTDRAGELVGRVLRYDPKAFRPQAWNPKTRRWAFGGFPPVLYRLPQVAAAIAVGAPVYLVEGEKDADTAVNQYGEVGTSNASGGATGHFLPAHAEQLRGAHVVIVADRDPTGYGHAVEAADRLAGIAATVRTVHARAGKDLTDHYAAGHSLFDLDDVDPRVELRLITGGKDDDSGGGGPPAGGGSDNTDDETPNYEPKYLYRHGKTVRVNERRKIGDPARYQVIWHCEVSILGELVNDDGDPDTHLVRGAVRLGLRRTARNTDGAALSDETGQPLWEQAEVLLPAEKINDGTWPDCLPWPGLLHNRSRKAKDDALEAAQMVVIVGPWRMQRQYTATGWRDEEGQWKYIHAGGAITPDGLIPLNTVELPRPIRLIHPPEPTTDQDRLLQAITAGFDPLVQLPARIVAPLIGYAFRGLLSPPQTSIHVAGLQGHRKDRDRPVRGPALGRSPTCTRTPSLKCLPVVPTISATRSRV